MQDTHLVVAIVAVVVLVIISLFVVVANVQRTVVVHVGENNKHDEKENKITIEELIERVAKRNASKNELTAAVLTASKHCLFPAKEKGIAPKSAKAYLNFVLLIASHHNADAKLIAFMDAELKKSNPEYKTEIDIYENEGINQRGNRI